ncbi:hypothetical protein CPC08DRAFT_820334, partial [Agrocybe pediades]
MDTSLSIAAGLGLRLFLASVTGEVGHSYQLPTAALGLWEGIVVHQISGRSFSPHLDHILAYGLRIVVDLLVTKDMRRMAMVVLWTVFGTFISELITPYESLRAAVEKEIRRRERRHRHSRSVPAQPVPVIAAPLPPRVRAYRQSGPDQGQTSATPYLPPMPPGSSTPIFPLDERPATPPSFFLQENTPLSPSPKPVQLQFHPADESSPRNALPVRPRSALASVLDQSPDSGSPLPVPMHLPTPPESAQS